MLGDGNVLVNEMRALSSGTLNFHAGVRSKTDDQYLRDQE